MSFSVKEALGGNISPQVAAMVEYDKLIKVQVEKKLEIGSKCDENKTRSRSLSRTEITSGSCKLIYQFRLSLGTKAFII